MEAAKLSSPAEGRVAAPRPSCGRRRKRRSRVHKGMPGRSKDAVRTAAERIGKSLNASAYGPWAGELESGG
ncbi:uncharacterized protein VTP21DRAFT_4998 [Calcarisporiella thermophila]|uniref:uncharacterized protein n=1 Tax=Calcarisporiella thermophila TaxID=911321 RepID=UPI0037445D43